MGLNTDFNQSPYFDDFDETKNYHRVLFKPATAVQARELTQLQTILQNQIERFGDNILNQGTIIQGGNFVEETRLYYAKIRDIAKTESEAEVATDVNQYSGLKAVGQQYGVEAIIVDTAYGLESQTPDLSTIFIKYTKSGTNGDLRPRTFAAGEEVWLYSKDTNGDYTQKYHLVTIAPTTVDAAPVGRSYGVRCGEGIIYQKGHFIRFENALTVVSKYSNQPDGVVVGFQTEEYIVDSNEDSSLLDNANGFNNAKAPGADRLQLIPNLVVKTLAAAKADETFFAIQEYAFGKVVRRNVRTQYNTIAKEMERRTSEESGDYVVQRFNVRTSPNKVDPTKLTAYVSPGLAYVDGQRVELLSEIGLDVPDATTYAEVVDQNISSNYGEWLSVTPTTGSELGKFDFTTLITVNLVDGASATIGTARIKAVVKRSSSEFRFYLTAIKMNSGKVFKNSRRITSAAGGNATINLVSGNAVLQDAKFTKSLFNLGKSFIRSVDDTVTSYIYRTKVDTTVATSTFTITLTGDNEFPYAKSDSLTSDQLLDIIVVANADQGVTINQNDVLTVSSASLDSTGKILTVTVTPTISSSISLTVYYTARAMAVAGTSKDLKTVYVKVNTATAGTSGSYTLGLSDVYSLEGVWLADTSVGWTALQNAATAGSSTYNVTNYFKLVKGQTDSYYGLSGVKLSRSLTIDSTTYIIVKAKVFYRAASGNFVTVNNYPVDDTTTPLPADKIRTEQIPSHTATDGTVYNLRDVVDLRPYAANTAAYAETASSATTNPSSTLSFGTVYYPAPNQQIDTAYSYYLGRNDNIIIDSNGDFILKQGTPAEAPTYPPEPTNGMLLARLSVPPFPTLDADTASQLGKPDYGVQIRSNQTQRYTMKDIGAIDNRIKNLEYYTSLSLLETSAKDFMVTDPSGANRFKNGIFVDNFESLALGKVGDGQFAVAIDKSIDNITPKVRQYPLGLKWVSGSDARRFSNRVTTLNKTDVLVTSVSQEYATAVKNCTTNFWSYNGQVGLVPQYDFGVDTKRAPAVNIDLDFATPLIEYNQLLSEFIPLIREERTAITNRITEITTIQGNVSAGASTTQNLGDFVTDINIKPYIRGKNIQVKAVGMRPNTRMYFFFDGVDVTNEMARAVDNDATANTDPIDSATTDILDRSSAFNTPIYSDDNGVVRAIFRLRKDTFFVGERKLEILDVNDLADRDAATTYAATNYNAFNYSVKKTSLSATTTLPQFSQEITNVRQETRGRRSDPLAQTFIIESDVSSDTHVFLTKLDLFFAKKSRAGNGVGIQIREVDNGYPSGIALPYSSIRLSAAQVNAPTSSIATTATTATTIVFEAPVALKTNKEYAIIIAPEANDPDYLVWIARTGEIDIDTQTAITQDTNGGVLFTSTNNKTWTPYQNENLKFNIYSARFSTATGTVTLSVDNPEFFAIDNLTGDFIIGEDVVIKKTSYLSGTLSVTAGSTTVTGVGTAFLSDYTANRQIVIVNGSDVDVYTIKSITNDTTLILTSPSRATLSGKNHYTSPMGKLVYFNENEPAKMILEGSTAASGYVFADGNKVIGATSGATIDITIDSLNVSYMQAMINRLNFSKTVTLLSARINSGGEFITKDIKFGGTNYLTDNTYTIRSKSSVPSSNQLFLDFGFYNTSSSTRDTSPIVDFEASSIMVGEYMVNTVADATLDPSERDSLGLADTRYISKVVQLADGMDAEDIRVILGAYKPAGTKIRVYAKFQSATDSRNFDNIEWTRLYIKPETDSTSSTANRFDYREFEYQLDTTSKSNGAGAWDNSGTINYLDEDGALYQSYKYFAIKIVMMADSHNVVPRIKDLRALALS